MIRKEFNTEQEAENHLQTLNTAAKQEPWNLAAPVSREQEYKLNQSQPVEYDILDVWVAPKRISTYHIETKISFTSEIIEIVCDGKVNHDCLGPFVFT